MSFRTACLVRISLEKLKLAMQTNLSNLSKLLDVPATDSDDARRRRLLNIFLVFVALIVPITTLPQVFIGPRPNTMQNIFSEDNLLYWYGSLAIWTLCAIVFTLNRFPRVPGWVAGNLFLLGIMVIFAFMDSPVELVSGRSTIIFIIPVFMAAFLLGAGGSLIYSLLIAIELLVLTWAGNLFQSGNENFSPMIVLVFSGFIALVSGRNSERSIRETRRLSSQRAAILQGISDGVILFDPEGKIIVHNSSASRILNRQLDNCRITELVDAIGDHDNADKFYAVWAGRNRQERIEVRGLTLTIAGSEIRDVTGGLIGTAIMLHDVTKEAQVERAKDTILGLSSHEMRTPLAAMMGYAQLLQKLLDQGEEGKMHNGLAAIVNNAKRLNTTLSSLSTLAELQAGRLTIDQKPIKTTDLLVELEPMKRQALAKGLEFQVESSLSSDTLTTDPIHLKQVLTNLVGNAIKFTDRGSVSIRLYQMEESCWGIEVIDTGPGIEADRMPVLFEAFSLAGSDYATRTFQGIGLGLTVAKRLIELMDGSISVESQVGAGTKVIVEFPLGKSPSSLVA
jgi:signal transduction histidine kinase